MEEKGTYMDAGVTYTASISLDWEQIFRLERMLTVNQREKLAALGKSKAPVSEKLEALAILAKKMEGN